MSDTDDVPEFEGEPITQERLEHDLSFDESDAPDDALTDDDARASDLDPSEDEAEGE